MSTHKTRLKRKLKKLGQKGLVFLLIFSLLVQSSLFLIPSSVFAASSPWTQTDWSGGSGQTSWGDTTKFSSSSSIDTTTAGQTTLSETSNWYNTSWKYRQEITIDSSITDSDLTNFPALIKITDSSNDIFADAQADGDDLLFTSSDGTTKLDHEIEKFDTSSGNEELDTWVEIPTLSSSSNTVIYMYYGNTSAVSQQNGTGVWDSNYKMVQHLDESPANDTAGHLDSTSNNNDGTPNNFDSTASSTTDGAGQIDGADVFDDTDDYVEIPDSSILETPSQSISAWFKQDTTPAVTNTILTRDNGIQPDRIFQLTAKSDNTVTWIHSTSGTTWDCNISNVGTVTNGQWHHIVATYDADSGNCSLYLDGSQVGTDTATGDLKTSSIPITIGKYTGPTPRYFDGQIDDVRIYNYALSASQIKNIYNHGAVFFGPATGSP